MPFEGTLHHAWVREYERLGKARPTFEPESGKVWCYCHLPRLVEQRLRRSRRAWSLIIMFHVRHRVWWCFFLDRHWWSRYLIQVREEAMFPASLKMIEWMRLSWNRERLVHAQFVDWWYVVVRLCQNWIIMSLPWWNSFELYSSLRKRFCLKFRVLTSSCGMVAQVDYSKSFLKWLNAFAWTCSTGAYCGLPLVVIVLGGQCSTVVQVLRGVDVAIVQRGQAHYRRLHKGLWCEQEIF